MADKKIGNYICTGCGIGDALDAEALSNLASGDMGCASVKTHPALCGKEGLEMINSDARAQGIEHVVIAACSPRAMTHAFQFGDLLMDRINLREGVAWVLPPNDEDTQWLAEDYMRMGITKAKKTERPEPFQEGDFYKDILVVGGGVAGMTAALEISKAGSKATILEREANLGGFWGKLHKSIPAKPPYTELHDTNVEELIKQVGADNNIDVITNAEIERIDGGPCKFEVKVKANGKEIAMNMGAIVMATGFKPYDANKLGHLGYGKFKDVVTSVELEEMAKNGNFVRPSDGKPVNSVLFLQCAGSRDPEHLPYCSSVCCNTTLKQATYLKQANPDCQAYVLYKDMRTPGQGEEFYRQAQRNGAVFIRGEMKGIDQPNGKLKVTADDVLLGEDVDIEDLDLVVLATGMEPTTKMPGETVEAIEGDDLKRANILHLNYRQGPEIPNLRYGYPDSHFICFPYETRRTGIYAAGTVRRAMSGAEAMRDATGAALKAIQCVELTSVGKAVHPRPGDESYPSFFMQRCTQCKRCTEECPFGAINEDEKANPLPNITRCRRCGTCMGACPERIISFKNYSVGMINDMVKSIEVPDEDEEKPCVIAFICENDAFPVLDEMAKAGRKFNPYVRYVPLRCLGSVNLIWIADSLSKGIDGIVFFGCKHGDDYQCHFVKGSELCSIRLSKVQETLDRLMLESERVVFKEVSMNDAQLVNDTIEEFMETLEDLGPNPFKGF